MTNTEVNEQKMLAEFREDFARRFKGYRADYGMTQVAFGRIIGVTPEEISTYENSRAMPSLPTLWRIARKLRVPMSELLGE